MGRYTEDLVSWDVIARCAGPNPLFPKKDVYAFGTLSRMFPGPAEEMKDWMEAFRNQAKSHGMDVEVLSGVVYVTRDHECHHPSL